MKGAARTFKVDTDVSSDHVPELENPYEKVFMA